jgi:hypothetical protein
MKYLDDDMGKLDADCAEDATTSTVRLEQQMEALDDKIRELPADAPLTEKADLELGKAAILVDLQRGEEAYEIARHAFDIFFKAEEWGGAAQACNLMFQSEQQESLAALGQGIWLAVTYPVDPELTVALLQHVIDETPDDSDGAALAATVARFIVDLRSEGKQKDDLIFFTTNMMGAVARRHSNIESQEQFDLWADRLELKDPAKFLVRFRNVVDVLVQDNWWFDREALQEKLPVN